LIASAFGVQAIAGPSRRRREAHFGRQPRSQTHSARLNEGLSVG